MPTEREEQEAREAALRLLIELPYEVRQEILKIGPDELSKRILGAKEPVEHRS
ncbi:MAG TPA: hypothetical protein VMF66_03585 [Candidatus Acidoferrum sp.]|nr:hypothetical protein [Candidatus Acidoferrum sp.]